MKKMLAFCIALFALAACSPASDKPVKPLPSPVAKSVAPPSSDTPVTPVAKDGDIPKGFKVVFALARTRAVGELAKKENISRAAAREKIDSISDKELYESAKVAGLTVAKDYPGEGKLSAIIDWLIEHQDLIKALVVLILSFFSA